MNISVLKYEEIFMCMYVRVIKVLSTIYIPQKYVFHVLNFTKNVCQTNVDKSLNCDDVMYFTHLVQSLRCHF